MGTVVVSIIKFRPTKRDKHILKTYILVLKYEIKYVFYPFSYEIQKAEKELF